MKARSIIAIGIWLTQSIYALQITNSGRRAEDSQHATVVFAGSGPAALTGGMYAAREQMKPIIIKGPTPGGQLMNVATITNWPGELSISGADLIEKITLQATKAGARFIDDTIKAVNLHQRPFKITLDSNTQITCDTFVVATGSKPRMLNIPGEKKYWGKGVSVCALCDGTFFKDKPIAIVGDGYLALKNACTMKNQTSDITILAPGTSLKGPRLLRDQVQKAGVKVIYHARTSEIVGNNKTVTGIQYTTNGVVKTLPTSAVFVSIGFVPNTEFLNKQLALDETGKIIINKRGQTNVAGVYAAGSCTNVPNPQAVVCSAAGCMAACEVDKFLDTAVRKATTLPGTVEATHSKNRIADSPRQ